MKVTALVVGDRFMARMAMPSQSTAIVLLPGVPTYLAHAQLLFARIVSWVDVINTARPNKLHL